MNILFRYAVFCFLFAALTACHKNDPAPEKTNFLQAKINGALWSPGSVNCVLLVDTTYNFRVVSITSTSGGKTVTAEASDNATAGAINTGTRTFESGSASFIYNTSGIPYNVISGSINITSVEASAQKVSGTFDYTVEDAGGSQVHISDGNFVSVSYSVKVQ